MQAEFEKYEKCSCEIIEKCFESLDNGYDLYQIKADYRPRNPSKPSYHILATSHERAVHRFKMRIPWLTIYSCTPCDKEKARRIIKYPANYIYF